MQRGDDTKRLVKNAENWQVEFKLANGRIPDTFQESYSALANTDDDLCKLAGYVLQFYDPDQVEVKLQVGLLYGKSVAVKNAVNSTVQFEIAVRLMHKGKDAPKVTVDVVKRMSPKARVQVVENCAELYPCLKEYLRREVQKTALSLGYSEGLIFNCLGSSRMHWCLNVAVHPTAPVGNMV